VHHADQHQSDYAADDAEGPRHRLLDAHWRARVHQHLAGHVKAATHGFSSRTTHRRSAHYLGYLLLLTHLATCRFLGRDRDLRATLTRPALRERRRSKTQRR